MSGKAYHHPTESLLDDLWNAGHTPRIRINSTAQGVDVPEFVRAKHGTCLVIDLDPAWPLNLATSKESLQVDLAFQGTVYRCTFPWTSIYVVIDKTTGRGIVIEPYLPALTPPKPSAPAVEGSRGLRLVEKKPEDGGGSDRKATEVRPEPVRRFGVIKGGKSN